MQKFYIFDSIKGEGMYDANSKQKGDLIVNFNIVFPQVLSANQKRNAKQILAVDEKAHAENLQQEKVPEKQQKESSGWGSIISDLWKGLVSRFSKVSWNYVKALTQKPSPQHPIMSKM